MRVHIGRCINADSALSDSHINIVDLQNTKQAKASGFPSKRLVCQWLTCGSPGSKPDRVHELIMHYLQLCGFAR